MKTLNVALFCLILFFPVSDWKNSCEAQPGDHSKSAQPADERWNNIDNLCRQVEDSVISWRRRIHQYMELGNREFRTSQLIAGHLRRLGLEVQTGVAHTGVVGILRGRTGGPVIALRADMDALPVKELANVPFASRVITSYNGQEVPVMHACGHDAHASILMGTAEVLTKLKDELKGTVKFIFQPAEDSKPENEFGGSELMIREGVLENPGDDIQSRIRRTAVEIAESGGAAADISFSSAVPALVNDQKLTEIMGKVLDKVGLNSGVTPAIPITVGDDFSLYSQNIPGFYFLLGVAPDGVDPFKVINHSPYFIIEEKALLKGVEALSHITVDYLYSMK